MEQSDVKKKKDDLQVFSIYVSGLLQNKTNAVLKKKSKLLTADIDEFLNAFEVSAAISVDSVSFKIARSAKSRHLPQV